MKQLRVVRSHAEIGRIIAEFADESIGEIPRAVTTPYASGPTHTVWDWKGQPVIVAETAHKVYRVFAVDQSQIRTPEQAETEFLARTIFPEKFNSQEAS